MSTNFTRKISKQLINTFLDKKLVLGSAHSFNLIAGFLGFEMVSYYSLGPSSSERDSLKINF